MEYGLDRKSNSLKTFNTVFIIIWLLIAMICWFYLTPSINQMKNLEFDWISFIFFRNIIIVILYVGFFHWYWYSRKYQNSKFKYNVN